MSAKSARREQLDFACKFSPRVTRCKKFANMTDSKSDKAKVDLGLLEEDDEFEEFPAEGTYFLIY